MAKTSVASLVLLVSVFQFTVGFLHVNAADTSGLLLTEIQSNQAAGSTGGDFWELTNVGTTPVDLSGWKWDDNSYNPADAAAVTIPQGTTIAPGESIVFTGVDASAFRTWWGIGASVKVVSDANGPGLGGGDGIGLYQPDGSEVFKFSYDAAGVTLSDGAASVGGHAGLSAGGTLASLAMVLDPTFGTDAGRRYTAAAVGSFGAFAATGSGDEIGSPGVTGLTGSASDLLLTEIQSNQAVGSTGADYWELSNVGAFPIDLSGWKWDDNSYNPADPAAVTIPQGTTIAGGESILFTAADATAFRAWWGIGATVRVISDANSPGLGGGDGIGLYKPDTTEVFRFSYAAAGVTLSDGSASAGGHAGLSAGGALASIALILDPTFGTGAGRRYTAAAVGTFGAFAATGSAAEIGSPGVTGLGAAGPPAITTQPLNATIAAGNTATLTVTATGAPAPNYQWYAGTSGDTANPVGTDSAAFTTPALTAAASYWVRVSNAHGTVDSSTATVYALPVATGVNLSQYIRVGRYDLPEPKRTIAPAGNLLAQEVSGVTYNWDTDTLFVVGDGGTALVQVSKTGQLIDTMTLAAGASPQGTEFYDPEGITYVGNGKFVLCEERDRQLVEFTYAAGTTLTRAAAKTVKLGTFSPNIGIEGLSYDPQTTGFICVKEATPAGVFQTTVDFDAGTASNGSATTENSANLFDPALLGLTDIADVFALANLPSLNGQTDAGDLLVLSQEDARIVKISRTGVISSILAIQNDAGNPLSLASQQHEGLTMDRDGVLYVVSENGGGDADHPQLWVYVPSSAPNAAPTAVALANTVTSLPETTSTAARVKVADIEIADDALGFNTLAVSGADANVFEVSGFALYLKAGTVLDFETRTGYSVTVTVDDTTVGNTPDASTSFTLNITDVVNEGPAPITIFISEVAPWSSGNSPVGGDWFELSNLGASPIDVTGWRMDDDSATAALGADLTGVTTVKPGESVIFLETADLATARGVFLTNWFGTNPPAGLQVGAYDGPGLGSGGDAVNIFDSNGVLRASLSFGASPSAAPFATFDNAAALDATTINRLSVPRVYGGFIAVSNVNEIGSPGSIGGLIISEVAPWSSGNSPVGADWFEVSNIGARPIDLTGWKMDDNSQSPAAAVPLSGIATIAPGESVIFIETADLPAVKNVFLSNWFGANPPAGLQFGAYDGAGLSTGGDAVNLYDTSGTLRAYVAFGAAPGAAPFATFDNAVGLNNATISQMSIPGVFGAAGAANASEIGSPGSVGGLIVSEVAPWASGSSPVGVDWFEVANIGAQPVDVTGWRMDDDSAVFGSGAELTGIGVIAPGETVVFLDTADLATTKGVFLTNWFGANPPAGIRVGAYDGPGLGTGGDAVFLFDSNAVVRASISFGASPGTAPFATFNNAAGQYHGLVNQLTLPGANGAMTAVNSANEIGSPGVDGPRLILAPVVSGKAMVVWPAAAGFQLEETSTPAVSASWTSPLQLLVPVNGLNTVEVPAATGGKFFRLKKP